VICSSCNSIFAASSDQLGVTETLAGLCETCGTEPRLARLARSFNEGAIAGAISIELFLLLLFLDDWRRALLLPLIVAIICVAIYVFAQKSEPIRYDSEEHRKTTTKWHRIFGWAAGFAFGIAALLLFAQVTFGI